MVGMPLHVKSVESTLSRMDGGGIKLTQQTVSAGYYLGGPACRVAAIAFRSAFDNPIFLFR